MNAAIAQNLFNGKSDPTDEKADGENIIITVTTASAHSSTS